MVVMAYLFVNPLPPRAWSEVIMSGMVKRALRMKFVSEAITDRMKSPVGSKGYGTALLGASTGLRVTVSKVRRSCGMLGKSTSEDICILRVSCRGYP